MIDWPIRLEELTGGPRSKPGQTGMALPCQADRQSFCSVPENKSGCSLLSTDLIYSPPSVGPSLIARIFVPFAAVTKSLCAFSSLQI